MAVSLVSTGVQFPDATIQTTAASASPFVLLYSTNALSGYYATVDSTVITSTYNNYFILLQGTINYANYGGMYFDMAGAGPTWATSGYGYMVGGYNGSWYTQSAASYGRMTSGPTSGSSYLTSYYPVCIECYLYNVNDTTTGAYKQMSFKIGSSTGNDWSSTMVGGAFQSSLASQVVRGIRFYNGSVPWGNGFMRVYGIKNS